MQFDHLIKAKCYINGMLYCIKNLVNKPDDFTTLRPLTDVKEFVIFLFVSDNSEFGMFV